MAKKNNAKKQTPEQKAAKQAKYNASSERKEQSPQPAQTPTASKSTATLKRANTLGNRNASQERAAFVMTSVKSVIARLDEKQQKEFKSYVQGLPAMVQINGLGQAIAFYRSHFTLTDKTKKGAAAYSALYDILNDWLCGDMPLSVYPKGDLLDCIVSHDMHDYRLAQSELQSLLVWLKNMTVALVEVADEDGE